MIEFVCNNCGKKISVQKIQAGKEIRCPKCHNIIFVPKAEPTDTSANQSNSEQIKTISKDSAYDSALLDILEKEKISAWQRGQSDIPDETSEREQETEEESSAGEELIDQRKLPWFIDIFLYPFSKSGLINLAIFIGALPLIGILGQILPSLFSCLFYLITLAAEVLIFLYLYWYLTECIRNSADGFVRAPEGLRAVSSLADMFGQTVNIIGCFGVFLGPFVVYTKLVGGVDMISWLLLGFAVFLYPMGMLSVIMFDSVRGLKPRLLITSIHNTFFPYSGLTLLFALLTILSIAIFEQAQISQSWRIIIRSVIIYSALICAHLLGRFYWRYQEKLNWGI